jgi:hypothetical protein
MRKQNGQTRRRWREAPARGARARIEARAQHEKLLGIF